MKVSQLLLTATTCGGLLAGLLHFAQPTDWFAPPSATAVVEVRVVDREVERLGSGIDERDEPREDVVGGLCTGVQQDELDVVARAQRAAVTSCRDRPAG